jgi:hypothetical protein
VTPQDSVGVNPPAGGRGATVKGTIGDGKELVDVVVPAAFELPELLALLDPDLLVVELAAVAVLVVLPLTASGVAPEAPNGSRAAPVSREWAMVLSTLTAGRPTGIPEVPVGATGTDATGVLEGDFATSTGTAMRPAASTTASGHRRFSRRSSSMPFRKLIALVG